MSAEDMGRRLLGDVKEEALDELLSDLRHLLNNPKPRLGIPQLDQLLEIFCAPAQAPTRPGWSSPNPDDDHHHDAGESGPAHSITGPGNRSSMWKAVVVELTSSSPACGKTQLFYRLTALAVLHRARDARGTAVVWLDTDGRFSATRLREVILGFASPTGMKEDRTESIVKEAMSHIHVFRPRSSTELIETLDYLPEYLLDMSAHVSMQRCLGLLVLDSATTFYWQDRLNAENARFEHSDQPRIQESQTAAVIKRLKKVQKDFSCAIVLSTSANFTPESRYLVVSTSSRENSAPQETRSVSPWKAFAALTLSLSRLEVPQFASHMSLEECLSDRQKRQNEVSKGVVVIEVDRSTSERWTSGMRNKLNGIENQGTFTLDIIRTGSADRHA